MNELEKYKLSLKDDYGIYHDVIDDARNNGREEGFDIAVALDLPVKFAKWFDSKEQSFKEWQRSNYFFGRDNKIEEAYKYWIENILKIE